MARYRKLDVRIWIDDKFQELSPPPPCGRYLWFYLLTNPETVNVPGLYRAGEAAMAESLGWPLKGFRKAFREAFSKGMVKADWRARVIWVPKAIFYNKPENPNVVKSWASLWDEIPDCALKLTAYQALKAFLEGLGEGFAEAFEEGCRKPFGKGMAKQEQEQEQEQEQKTPIPGGRGSDQPHQRVIDTFLTLKGTPRSTLTPAQVTGQYKRHSRSAVALITDAGGLDHALAALAIGAAYFDAKRLSWTLDTIGRHLPDIARWSQEPRGGAAGFTPAQVSYAESLRAWLRGQPRDGGGSAPGAQNGPAHPDPPA